MRFKLITSACLLLLASAARSHDLSEAGKFSWQCIAGVGAQKGAGSNLHLLAGTGPSFGVGQHLALEVVPLVAGIVSNGESGGSYLLDLPLALTSYFRASESVSLAIGGGVGAGFSDMAEWQKSNRALTGHLMLALTWYNSNSTLGSFELRITKASTSTGNATLGHLTLRYAIGL